MMDEAEVKRVIAERPEHYMHIAVDAIAGKYDLYIAGRAILNAHETIFKKMFVENIRRNSRRNEESKPTAGE